MSWLFFFFSSRRRHTRFDCDWSSDVCSSDLIAESFHGSSVRLLQEGNRGSISLEYSSEKNTEIDIDDKNHWAPKCIRSGTSEIGERRVGKECRSRWSPYH